MQKTKKGISLIVLVITIIVMIILAATIIISLTNNGIIDKANDAVDKTNEKQVEELVNLAWADAYADNVGKSNEELLQALKTSVEKALSDNNLAKEDYGMEVTTTGVTIVKGWLQKADRTVVKGDTVLNIGSTIDYTDKAGENGAEKYTGDWKVLGAENGELLIMSAENVTTQGFNSDWDFEEGKRVYESALDDLKEICAPYGTGAYATGARSITVEDVDRVTGYDKTTYEYTSGSYKIKYGESITYSWDNESGKEAYPYYKITRGTTKLTGNLSQSHSSFTYHNGKEWVTSAKPSGLADKQEICTLTQTYYYYDADQKTDLAKGTDAYSMLFGNDNVSYWLASPYVDAYEYYASFGLRYVGIGYVYGCSFVNSYGYGGGSYGVRVVVSLSSDFNP